MDEIEEMYNKYFKDVFYFVYRLSRDKHIAEDITSETFFKAMKSIESFKGNCDLRVWLCQIAKNSYFSYLRKNKNLVNIDSITEKNDEFDMEKAITLADESIRLHEIINVLSEPYREVFSLRVFGELSFREIAKLLGKTDNWACVTFHRARNKIKMEMRDYNENNL